MPNLIIVSLFFWRRIIRQMETSPRNTTNTKHSPAATVSPTIMVPAVREDKTADNLCSYQIDERYSPPTPNKEGRNQFLSTLTSMSVNNAPKVDVNMVQSRCQHGTYQRLLNVIFSYCMLTSAFYFTCCCNTVWLCGCCCSNA